MATRIAGVLLPDEKRIEIALTRITGIGRHLSNRILHQTKIHPDTRTKDLTAEEIARLREIIEKEYKVEGELRREVLGNIKRLKEIGSYRGIRHMKNLTVRSQRTRTNSRTVRGNVRRTVASGKKPTAEKT